MLLVRFMMRGSIIRDLTDRGLSNLRAFGHGTVRTEYKRHTELHLSRERFGVVCLFRLVPTLGRPRSSRNYLSDEDPEMKICCPQGVPTLVDTCVRQPKVCLRLKRTANSQWHFTLDRIRRRCQLSLTCHLRPTWGQIDSHVRTGGTHV